LRVWRASDPDRRQSAGRVEAPADVPAGARGDFRRQQSDKLDPFLVVGFE
jgi:hypothetical protein